MPAVVETQFELRLKAILEGYSLPGLLTTIGTTTLRVYLKNSEGHVILAEGNVIPTATDAGYAKGCLFVKNDALTTVRGLYENIGLKTSCLFQKVGSVRPGDVELTAGKVLYGVGGLGAEKVVTIAASMPTAHVHSFIAPAAAGVQVHAAVAESDANAFPGAFTSPVIPRSLQVVFAAGFQGGDVTVIGTDQFDDPVTETFVSNPGATVLGVKIFKTVISAAKAAVLGAADTCTLQTGPKLGIDIAAAGTSGLLTVDGTSIEVVIDTTYSGFTPTTAADGARDFILIHNIIHSHTIVFT